MVSKLTQLLHKLLVLVKLLQSLGIHARKIVGIGLIAMLLISQDAYFHSRPGDVLKPEEM